MTEPRKFLRRNEAAAFIQNTWNFPCNTSTLAKYAVVGGGPAFRRAGRIPLYTPEDLSSWVEGRMSKPVRSTAELRAAAA